MTKSKTVMFGLKLTLYILVLPQLLVSQQSPEILTNAKVIDLVKMGLSESLIVAKIKRSICDCDTSTSALGKLKAAKVSDSIILAMIEASEAAPSRTVRPSPTTNSQETREQPAKPSVDTTPDAGLAALRQIAEPGIYIFENGKMTAIEASVFSGGKINPLLGTITYGIKKTKWRAKVRGKTANLTTSNSQPVFYFVFNPEYKNSGAAMAGLFWGMPATSPNEFMMVQMNIKEASREAVLGEYGVWTGATMGARDKDIREYSFEKIKPGIYKVVPKTQLAPGEYCFYYAGNVTGIGFAGGKVFDFAIK
ncbi:MAG TPA: hypothetical protein PKA82_12950 [Pyrinomonadaceae bacterium]|nr:hypothetical protein [Pyrinomonadaceae bacterium]